MSRGIVEKILEMPSAPKLLEELNLILKAEKQKRMNFYKEITDQEKAEFINGEIIIHSPVNKSHSDVCKRIGRLIDVYVDKKEIGFVGIEKVMVSLTRNDYEPDVCYFRKEKSKNFKKGQSKFPGPDFVIEVLSKGTEHRDRGIKFEDYQEHGVAEYWIISPKEETVEQYLLEGGKYSLKLKSRSGEIESPVIHGFVIPIRAIFDKDANLKELQRVLLG